VDNFKRLKRGEVLFRENDLTNTIWVVQSGKIGLILDRGGKRLEIMTLGPSQVLGEQALFSAARQPFMAEALQETKVMEVPVEILKKQMEQAPPGVRLLLKSMVDESRTVRLMVRSLKMETDKSPCPQIAIPRICSLLNLVARHTGKPNPENPNEITVDWNVLKLYTTRMFAESPQRMRGLLDLMTKLGHFDLIIGKSEEGAEELQKAVVHNIQLLEDFAEFYQYNLYKGSYSEVIHVDTLAFKVAKALVALAEPLEVDRRGAVQLLYDTVLAEVKEGFGFDLKSTHLDVLEKKGLFVKRQSRDDGTVHLSYDKVEYKRIVTFWAIIHEIDKWNEKGFVNMNEKEVASSDATSEACPQCSGKIDSQHKFCPNCGFKLAA